MQPVHGRSLVRSRRRERETAARERRPASRPRAPRRRPRAGCATRAPRAALRGTRASAFGDPKRSDAPPTRRIPVSALTSVRETPSAAASSSAFEGGGSASCGSSRSSSSKLRGAAAESRRRARALRQAEVEEADVAHRHRVQPPRAEPHPIPCAQWRRPRNPASAETVSPPRSRTGPWRTSTSRCRVR